MAWSNSKVFRPFLASVLVNGAAWNLSSDTIKAALYDNDITPDNDVTLANSAYGGGVWTTSGSQDGSTGSQIYHTGHWAQGGQTLGTLSVDSATADTVFFDAADTASTDSATTISNAYGVLVYDTTITSYGLSYNYFGGSPQNVTAGSFTIVWHANGIFRFSL